MGVRLRSSSGGSVQLDAPAGVTSDVVLEVPALAGAKLLTDKSPGTVLQVVQAFKRDTFVSSASGDTLIPGLSVTITPKSTTSRFLINFNVNYDSTRGNSGGGFRIFRNGSHWDSASGIGSEYRYTVCADFGANANADQSGMSRSFSVVDTPVTTAAITYALAMYQDSVYTSYINRARSDANNGDDPRMASSLIVMEIAA